MGVLGKVNKKSTKKRRVSEELRDLIFSTIYHKPLSIKEIARELGKDKSNMSHYCVVLKKYFICKEEKGYRGRSKVLSLNKRGKEIIDSKGLFGKKNLFDKPKEEVTTIKNSNNYLSNEELELLGNIKGGYKEDELYCYN